MSTTSIVVVVAAALATVACVAWFLFSRKHPERAATHSDAPATTRSEELYGGADRPAGPDAESMDPDDIGGDHRTPRTS
jgi:hypothetical protein